MKILKRTVLLGTAAAAMIALFLLAPALLTSCGQRVTLRFETNGGTRLESVEGTVGASYKRPAEPQKEGYYFDGWYLSEDFSGEREELPDKMPDKSTTYYAKYGKYPHLLLSLDGGTLKESDLLVRPGTNLVEYLKDYVPQKEGLSFGGWFLSGEKLRSDALMSEEDLTLSARYLSDYSVDVFLEKADFEGEFEKSEELSVSGQNWEGEILSVEPRPIENFFLDETRSKKERMVLSPGENRLAFYYLRKDVSLTYSEEGERRTIFSRFGAHIPLEEGRAGTGLVFFGWAQEKNVGASYFAGDVLTLGPEDIVLYGRQARRYPSALTKGQLDIEELENSGVRNALYRGENESCFGLYRSDLNKFEGETLSGRLDERGYFLLNDSGTYDGFSLLQNKSDEAFGRLSLDFWNGSATLEKEGTVIDGKYSYLFEDGAYLGICSFSGEGESFRFRLKDNCFLKEGAEKGRYVLSENGALSQFSFLTLDGFGNAKFLSADKEEACEYLGSGEGDWKLLGPDKRFLLGERVWGEREREPVFFLYQDALHGTFKGSGVLILDGYGVSGEYLSAGERVTGNFIKEGDVVTLFGKTPLRFTLRGEEFFLTGDEAGYFDGERGELYLDGALKGTLSGEEGSYRKIGESEIVFSSAQKEEIRLKLKESSYLLYDKASSGSYLGAYGSSLVLDGYGGGIYKTFDKREIPIETIFSEGDLVEIYSPAFSEPIFVRLFSENKFSLIEASEVGEYPLRLKEGTLFLDGAGCALLSIEGGKERGNYRMEEGEVFFSSSSSERRFRLFEDGTCCEFGGKGVFEGDGVLTLDGYGKASFLYGGKEIFGSYKFFEGGADAYFEYLLMRFSLAESRILSRTTYEEYEGEMGTLFLAQEGSKALLIGEEEKEGSFSRANDVLSCFGVEMKLSLHTYSLYDAQKEKIYPLSDGSLYLDGSGGGIYRRGEIEAKGKIQEENGYLVLSSEGLSSYSGKIAFLITDSGAEAMGIEYGSYLSSSKEALYLDGAGGAVYEGVSGRYEKEGEGYRFTGGGISFVFRLKKGARFERKYPLRAGYYETNLGVLKVDEFGASLEGESVEILCGEENFLVFSAGGVSYLFRYEGDPIQTSPHFCV